jgi:hypothetical protein
MLVVSLDYRKEDLLIRMDPGIIIYIPQQGICLGEGGKSEFCPHSEFVNLQIG